MEDGEETFTLLPLQIVDSGKNINCILRTTNGLSSPSTSSTQDSKDSDTSLRTVGSLAAIQRELEALNELHQCLINQKVIVPPPPVPVNPKHSASITKLRESGNTSFRQGKHVEALRFYSLGLEMALRRPLWEPCGLFRDEVANLFANRSQVHMSLQNWPEGAIDAEASVEAKQSSNPKAWWRRGRCLFEMGRIDEALQWVERALEIEGHDSDLSTLCREIKKRKKEKKI